MFTHSVLVIGREDLKDKDKEFIFVHSEDFKDSIEEYYPMKIPLAIAMRAPLVIFVDTDGKTKILKNRYGDC